MKIAAFHNFVQKLLYVLTFSKSNFIAIFSVAIEQNVSLKASVPKASIPFGN
jgi:hypothetical protein